MIFISFQDSRGAFQKQKTTFFKMKKSFNFSRVRNEYFILFSWVIYPLPTGSVTISMTLILKYSEQIFLLKSRCVQPTSGPKWVAKW